MRVNIIRACASEGDEAATAGWMRESAVAVRAASTWQMLHKYVVSGGANDTEMTSGKESLNKAERLEELFKELDVDHSGSLDYDEFRQLLEQHGIVMSKNAFASLIRTIDVNGDGVIDHAEFAAHFSSGDA